MFDSIIENNTAMINVEKHVFYRDLYIFVDRLKDMIIFKNSNKLKNIISQCFRRFALIWHFAKLFDLEKKYSKKFCWLCDVMLQQNDLKSEHLLLWQTFNSFDILWTKRESIKIFEFSLKSFSNMLKQLI